MFQKGQNYLYKRNKFKIWIPAKTGVSKETNVKKIM